MKSENYPKLLDRLQAALIDFFVIILLIFLTTQIFSNMENVYENERIFAFVIIFVLYDPIFTSLFGATIGHFFLGIRVRKADNETKNINIFYALFRFIIKYFLGIISLFTVSFNSQKRAIHDIVTNSIVIYFKGD